MRRALEKLRQDVARKDVDVADAELRAVVGPAEVLARGVDAVGKLVHLRGTVSSRSCRRVGGTLRMKEGSWRSAASEDMAMPGPGMSASSSRQRASTAQNSGTIARRCSSGKVHALHNVRWHAALTRCQCAAKNARAEPPAKQGTWVNT